MVPHGAAPILIFPGLKSRLPRALAARPIATRFSRQAYAKIPPDGRTRGSFRQRPIRFRPSETKRPTETGSADTLAQGGLGDDPVYRLPELPGEVGEGLVGVGHAVDVFALGVGDAFAVIGRQEFRGQLLVHRPAFFLAAGPEEPADRQRLLAVLVDLHGDLVGSPADALRTDLDVRLHVFDSLEKDIQRLGVFQLFVNHAQRAVEHALCVALLAIPHHAIDKLAGKERPVLRIANEHFSAGSNSAHGEQKPKTKERGLRLLCSVAASRLFAALDAEGVQSAADNLIADARQVADAAAADQDDRVFLEAVALTRDIHRHFLAVREANSRDLPQGRVRLLGGHGLDLQAHPLFLGTLLQHGGLAEPPLDFPPLPD